MHCRNCANEVSDKAVACPQCGLNPRSEKKFCSSCGTATQPNQVICVKCGVSLASTGLSIDTSSLQNIEVSGLLKNKTFKMVAVLAVIAIGIYAYMQYASHLSHSEAQEIISQELNLPSPVTETVQHGLIRFTAWDRAYLNYALALQSRKILTCVQGNNNFYYTYQIDITPTGIKYKLADSTDKAGRQFYILKVADREFGEITGITESKDGKSATVDYTLLYKNFTPVGEVIGIREHRAIPVAGIATYKATLYFEKTDDGWKIKERRKRAMEELQNSLRGNY